MKYRKLSKWDDAAACCGLVYFAQMVEEMLFDYTLDTYKPSVMHTGLLCIEALQTIDEIEKGTIKAPNLGHVTAELCNCFEKDLVAQKLILLHPTAFYPVLKNPKSTLNETRTVLELLSVKLSPINYKKSNEELLIKELTGTQSYSAIRRLTRSYITTLIAIGYSQRFIYEQVLDFFYHGTNRISGIESIHDFLAIFSSDIIEFRVIFRVGQIFEGFANTLSEMELMITRVPPEGIDVSFFSDFRLRNITECYAVTQKVQARDVYSARDNAESLLKLTATLLTLFHHKKNPEWSPECVIHNTKDNSCKKVTKPINSMHKCIDLLESVANNRLKLLLNEFSLEQESFRKFIRSTQLHSMALSSNTAENQLLNLWISLESLIPSETKSDDTSNIEHITSSLIPFLNIGYIEVLLNNLIKDLLRWNAPTTKKALKHIDGRKFTDRLVKALIFPEYSSNLKLIEDCLLDFHLLRDRIEYFKQLLSSPANVIAALDAHKIRLDWQLRRIYRVRNIIVHSGNTPMYTKPLIEHTHCYLDIVLSTLVQLASKPKSIHSVSQGFKYVEMQYNAYYKTLTEKGIRFTTDNIDMILFSRL